MYRFLTLSHPTLPRNEVWNLNYSCAGPYFGFVSAQARLWLDHLQMFPPNQPSFFLAVLPDSQPRIQRQSRQRWHRPPSSSQNSIANLYTTTIYRQDSQNPYIVQTGNTSEMPRWGDNTLADLLTKNRSKTLPAEPAHQTLL